MTRSAISPRLAMRTFLNTGAAAQALAMRKSCWPYSTCSPFSTRTSLTLPSHLGLDLVHQLHRLDDADHLALAHLLAHVDEGGRLGRGRAVEGADEGRGDEQRVRVLARGRRRPGQPPPGRGGQVRAGEPPPAGPERCSAAGDADAPVGLELDLLQLELGGDAGQLADARPAGIESWPRDRRRLTAVRPTTGAGGLSLDHQVALPFTVWSCHVLALAGRGARPPRAPGGSRWRPAPRSGRRRWGR